MLGRFVLIGASAFVVGMIAYGCYLEARQALGLPL